MDYSPLIISSKPNTILSFLDYLIDSIMEMIQLHWLVEFPNHLFTVYLYIHLTWLITLLLLLSILLLLIKLFLQYLLFFWLALTLLNPIMHTSSFRFIVSMLSITCTLHLSNKSTFNGCFDILAWEYQDWMDWGWCRFKAFKLEIISKIIKINKSVYWYMSYVLIALEFFKSLFLSWLADFRKPHSRIN